MIDNFNSEEKLLQYSRSKEKHTAIIGMFALAKNMHFENQEQLNRFYKRQKNVATELDCYSITRIREILLYLLETADYKVGLETVLKYIHEDVKKLKGLKPIITLKSGEAVYDIPRLKELEKDKKIYYKNGTWFEQQ